MELYISRNDKDGKSNYYTTIKNNYNGVESKYYMPIQLPKGKEIEYGKYDVDFFFSCYTQQNGEAKPKIVIRSFIENRAEEGQASSEVKPKEENDPFADFGDSVSVDDNFLE